MQINHNIRAMVTQQALFQNDNAMTKSLEKLSTGLRINRAQDDAAGLAMSEQMRTQIRGLAKAKRNSQDGQAALQIAEGALAEITNMMQRQKELSVQSANDTLTSTERMYLNDEFQALTKEINRIANNTDYNGKNVLLFNVDPNKSFGATKLDPYNKEVSFLEAANVIRKVFGENLDGGLAILTTSHGSSSTPTGGIDDINTAIGKINAVIVSLNGILTDSNIQKTLISILGIADQGKTAASTVNFGNDLLTTSTVSYMLAHQFAVGEQTASNAKALKAVNDLIRAVDDALRNYQAAGKGELQVKNGAIASITYTFIKGIKESDYTQVSGFSATTGIGSLDRIINQLKAVDQAVTGASITDTATDAGSDKGLSLLAGIFGANASAQMQDDLKAVMMLDTNKMVPNTTGKTQEVVSTWQKYLGDLQDAYKVYSERNIATGSAASEVLHVGPNYSTGLGGATSNQIKVNYVAIDVKGLGLQAQQIETREGAQRAIDKLQETIKVTSSNRAAIGTYINRLDYTINNIASMEYNIQDAESRIRDTDFASETTSFTRNQIMVQAATSMLAQANSLPQAVLGLIG